MFFRGAVFCLATWRASVQECRRPSGLRELCQSYHCLLVGGLLEVSCFLYVSRLLLFAPCVWFVLAGAEA